MLFLIKGQAHFISDPIEMASLSVLIAEMSEMQIKDQSWKGVSVTPLAYQWPAGQSKRMEKMEDALFDQMMIELFTGIRSFFSFFLRISNTHIWYWIIV